MQYSIKQIAQVMLCFLLVILVSGCDVARQAQRVSTLANCDFRLRSVEQVTLAGVEFQHVKSISDVGISDVARILGAFTSPVFPLSLQLNLEGRNPNPREAGMIRLEWILFIDDIQMTSGFFEQPITIPANGYAIIPVRVGLDLKQALSGKSANAALNFCMNLAGAGGTPTRFKIKLKPTIMIAGASLDYPGYITVRTTYGNQ